MTPEELGRQALTTDAALCVTGGTLTTLASPVLGRWLGVPIPLVAGAGMLTTMWGGWVFVGAGAHDWRRPTAVVAVGNVAAAKGIGLVGLTRQRKSAKVALLAASGVAQGLAAAQGLALLRDRRQRRAAAAEAATATAPGSAG